MNDRRPVACDMMMENRAAVLFSINEQGRLAINMAKQFTFLSDLSDLLNKQLDTVESLPSNEEFCQLCDVNRATIYILRHFIDEAEDGFESIIS